jgi:protein-S-isoprenylcysteine O-methyltransferase Ste14
MIIADVQTVRNIVLGVAVLIGVGMFALTNSRHQSGTSAHEMIESAGIVAMTICILGRTWCSLYLGGRKIEPFVTVGPYSVSRNPWYFFAILGAAGAGAQLGSVLSGVIFGLLAWMVCYVAILQEERALTDRYGAEFAAYKASVPRFLPDPRLWRDQPTLTPPNVLRTFAETTVFLLAVPLAEAIEQLQTSGVLPVLLRLP